MATKTETTVDEPIGQWWYAPIAGAVLAALGGWALRQATTSAAFPDSAVAPLVPTVLMLVGAMFGAGLGLLLWDVRKTTTKKEETDDAGTLVVPPDVVKEGLALIKDLTPGKALLVLSIVLFSVLLLAIEPPAPAP